MHLPRRVYEALPYVYLLVGVAACAASYFGDGRLSDVGFLGGAAAVVAGIVLMLRRRSYRDDAARYTGSLDD